MKAEGSSILRRFAWAFALGAPPLAHVISLHNHGLDAALILPLAGLGHTVLYAALLVAFGWSLRPGREPIVARFARIVHGELPPDVAAYTRTATVAWCLFSAGQLAASGILFAIAPREVWSLFVNVLDLPLLGLMFAGEYVCRRLRFPDRAHIGLLATVRAFARRDAMLSRAG
jgi:uncharacterized membrane protein